MLPEKKKDKLTGPYGWEFHLSEEGYIPYPLATEIWVIRYAKQLYAFGCDLDEIATELRYDRIRPRHGGAWGRDELAEIIKRNDDDLWQRWKEKLPVTSLELSPERSNP
jgi:hypothetical protein